MKIKSILLSVLSLFIAINLFAQKDTVYSSSGDIIVGEIKSMSRNVLSFDTDYADSEFKIEWANVKGLVSKSKVIIHTNSGERYTGNLNYNTDSNRIVFIVNSLADRSIALDEIVHISTLSNGFWSSIVISLDAGYSYTKANSLSQFSMTGNVNYTADKWRLGGGFKNKGIAANTIWPATPIKSFATKNNDLGTEKHWRKPDIISDAILEIVREDPNIFTGNQLIDEEYLRAKGIQDFAKYRCVEKHEPPSLKDIFLL